MAKHEEQISVSLASGRICRISSRKAWFERANCKPSWTCLPDAQQVEPVETLPAEAGKLVVRDIVQGGRMTDVLG